MGVKVRQYKRRGVTDGVEVEVSFTWPSGTKYRKRFKSPVPSRSGAKAWGEQRLRELLLQGELKTEAAKAPTFAAFVPRYLAEYVKANRQKPSTAIQKERILEYYLKPRFGQLPLDKIREAEIQKLKTDLVDLSAKTVNNVLVVLNTLLKMAVKTGAIQVLPVQIELLRTTPATMAFYEPDEFERLVRASEAIDTRHLLFVLLGGEAGLRCGEIIALEQTDIDFARGILHVRRSEWEGHLTLPKGGRARQVNMTPRLAAALKKNRHLRGDRVLWRDDEFEKVTQVLLAKWMRRIQRRAGLKETGGIHILRHTFCSRLAIAGAPTKAIQELAGHQNLSTTQRYMHLSPAAKSVAIEMLVKSSQPLTKSEMGLENGGGLEAV